MEKIKMDKTATVLSFKEGQVVFIPKNFVIDANLVWIKKDSRTGEIILKPIPEEEVKKFGLATKNPDNIALLKSILTAAAKNHEDVFDMQLFRKEEIDQGILDDTDNKKEK